MKMLSKNLHTQMRSHLLRDQLLSYRRYLGGIWEDYVGEHYRYDVRTQLLSTMVTRLMLARLNDTDWRYTRVIIADNDEQWSHLIDLWGWDRIAFYTHASLWNWTEHMHGYYVGPYARLWIHGQSQANDSSDNHASII